METQRETRKNGPKNTKNRKEKVHGNTEANQEKWIIKTIRKRREKIMETQRHTSERVIKTLRKKGKQVHGNVKTNNKKWT